MTKVSIVVALLIGGAAFGQSTHVRELVRQLQSDDESQRVGARQMLSREGLPAAKLLMPALRDDRLNVRWTAFNVLRDIAYELSAPGRDAERRELTNDFAAMLNASESVRTQTQILRLISVCAPDDWDVAPVAALLSNAELREEARGALQLIGSASARGGLAHALQSADDRFRVALLDTLARMNSADQADAIAPYLAHDNAAIRSAAARARAPLGRVDDIARFRSAAKDLDDPARDELARATLLLTDAIIERGGNWDVAIRLYEELLESAQSATIKAAALSALAMYGDERAAASLIDATHGKFGEELKPVALTALAYLRGRAPHEVVAEKFDGLASDTKPLVLSVLGRLHEPNYQALFERESKSPVEAIRRAAAEALDTLAPPASAEAQFRPGDDVPFLRAWNIAGPFPWKPGDVFEKQFVNEPSIDLNATYTVGDATVVWRAHDAPSGSADVNLMGLFGETSDATAFAHTSFEVAEAADALLWLGSDDGIRAWLNGEEVHANAMDRGLLPDQDRVPIHLREGRNELLLQITQHLGGWAFCARISNLDNSPLALTIDSARDDR